MKINTQYFPLIIAATLAVGVIIGGLLNTQEKSQFLTKNTNKNKLYKLIEFIDNEYVDDVNTDSIVNLTVDAMLSKLDPHSVYIASKDQVEVAESMKGDFVGIGVNFYMYKDTVAVIRPVENGPSAKAGVKPGDRILYANKTKLFGRKLENDSLFANLKGEKGSDIELTLYRVSERKTLKVKLKRDVIPIKSVDAAVLIAPSIGYIKINRFAETTYEEFKIGLNSLKKQGAQSLVVDLRDNGGGYMEEAVAIADEFLPEKDLIVFTKNKKGKVEKTFATQNGRFETGKVFVLINENSASASEILAGAIQDNDRGLVVGRRSFGKGLVQREMNFNDGSAVRLTIARYYTPSGRSIQKPYSKGNDDYFKESENRFKNGELYQKDSIKVADSLQFKTKLGKIVYGGGGIVPDVFVPMQIQNSGEAFDYLLQTGIVGHFVFEQLDKNRSAFKNMTFESYNQSIKKSDKYVTLFQSYLFTAGLDIKLDKNKEIVKRQLDTEFGRQLFGEIFYHKLLLQQDPMVKVILKK